MPSVPFRASCLLLSTLLFAPFNVSANAPDQERVAREMIQVLEAYAVYKMGQFDEAFERYQALADAGNHQGMLNLGNMYAAGLGTEADLSKALHWYQLAADGGDAIGMYEVARALDNGLGTAIDKQAARLWYEKAAEADNTEAQWLLGKQLYEEGQSSEGLHWIRTAAHVGGHASARQFLETLEGTGKTGTPGQTEQKAVAQLFTKMNQAAQNKDAKGMVAAIADDAVIHIRLPHNSNWQRLNRAELQALWQKTFDQSEDYHYQRSEAQLLSSGDDILSSTLIHEQLQNKAGHQPLELHEQATLRVEKGQATISSLRLDIRQLSD